MFNRYWSSSQWAVPDRFSNCLQESKGIDYYSYYDYFDSNYDRCNCYDDYYIVGSLDEKSDRPRRVDWRSTYKSTLNGRWDMANRKVALTAMLWYDTNHVFSITQTAQLLVLSVIWTACVYLGHNLNG